MNILRQAWLLSVLAGTGAGLAAAQSNEGTPAEFAGLSDPVRVVHILDEPRHRTVFNADTYRLLDVQINPGDTTLPHTHDSAILYTFISNGQGPLNGRLSSVTTYVDEPFTHRVNNPGPGLFRIIALANFGEGVSENSKDLPEGINQEPELENNWFRAWRLGLPAGNESAEIVHSNPAFVVQIGEGIVHLVRDDGVTVEMLKAGDWAAIKKGQGYRVMNRADSDVMVIIKEAR
ncbi:hypothetical protein [Pseudohongiella spirulinae]|uniref:Cupin 2 conserved barrel domain-containing protein n=1 Tax=Pseudohongiella spirulinae TaxID=1249552 RepID=A0A0S2K9Q0_9GAMM|nr:hypothetical protein [Pseudohongiella spirulinae]ALO45073.1 hypothetical protein PS2015_384 [Pseudohongiella spirulinae]